MQSCTFWCILVSFVKANGQAKILEGRKDTFALVFLLGEIAPSPLPGIDATASTKSMRFVVRVSPWNFDFTVY